jgi:hypothetical protein
MVGKQFSCAHIFPIYLIKLQQVGSEYFHQTFAIDSKDHLNFPLSFLTGSCPSIVLEGCIVAGREQVMDTGVVWWGWSHMTNE